MHEAVPYHELKHALLERLVHYYHFVGQQIEDGSGKTVTSNQIAELIHTDATLVRKDLAAIGVRGHPRVGFRSAEVLSAIRDLLGFDEIYRALILGVGRLGSAMASYRGFARYGLDICALVDSDPAKVGLLWGSHVVLPMERLTDVVRGHDISVAILTVPAEGAQAAADQAVGAGIKAIWNFASTRLEVPENVFVRHEHISVGLAEISYHLRQKGD
jgi:redox-sensing transcriptional repressor